MITARILKYKVKRSMRKALLIGNGKPNGCVLIHIRKTFNMDDAEELVKQIGKLN